MKNPENQYFRGFGVFDEFEILEEIPKRCLKRLIFDSVY